MKLVPYHKDKLGGVFSRSENRKILEEFMNSGLDCAKVENFTQKSASTCSSSLALSIKRYHYTSIQAVKRGDEVFLVRKQS